MVTFRNYATSLCAVIVAVIVGALIGSGKLGSLTGEETSQHSRTTTEEAQKSRKEESIDESREKSLDDFAEAVSHRALEGTLADRKIVIMTALNADHEMVDRMKKRMEESGGHVTGIIGVTDASIGGANEEKLRTVLDNVIPEKIKLDAKNTDQQSRLGELVGLLISPEFTEEIRPEERSNAFHLLRENGFVSVEQDIESADATLIMTGNSTLREESVETLALARYAEALRGRVPATVVASFGNTTGSEVVSAIRTNSYTQVSTVDHAMSNAGQVAVILALVEQIQGNKGHYGRENDASSLAPQLS